MSTNTNTNTNTRFGVVRRALHILARVVTLVLCLSFIATTAFFVTPNNPMKMTYGRGLGVFGRFFGQNWKLFAPDPLIVNLDFYVQCSTRPFHSTSTVDPDGQWHDVTGPLWRQFHQHRFGAYDRLARPITSSLRAFAGGDESLMLLRSDCLKGEERSCKRFEQGLKASKEDASKMLGKVASAFCKDVEPERDVQAVSLRLVERAANPWSKRHEPPKEFVYTELGTYPAFAQIAAPGIWRAR